LSRLDKHMVSLESLTEDYIEISKRWNLDRDKFPLPLKPDNHGQEHIEFSDDGIVSLITTERGNTTNKRSTDSKDELFYWIFADEAFAKGWGYSMTYRAGGEDFRRAAFKHALAEISKLSDRWAKRFEIEIEDILKEHPFVDDKS